MIECSGNLWTYLPSADARVITTNGFVKASGEAVMGRGCAHEAVRYFPGIALELGALIQSGGNHVHSLGVRRLPAPHVRPSTEGFRASADVRMWTLFSFPVKHHWSEPADLSLIRRSCLELVRAADMDKLSSLVLPRPGCGNGQLNWPREVRPTIEHLLDNRFHVITYAP